MEEWKVSEEWGQAPEVQSHQLRKLCGAKAGMRRKGLRMSLQGGEKEGCRDRTPTANTVQLIVEVMYGNSLAGLSE